MNGWLDRSARSQTHDFTIGPSRTFRLSVTKRDDDRLNKDCDEIAECFGVWHPFAAKLLMLSKATVIPIYFAGQNSRMFQLASHLSYTWRLSLFFWETARRIGSTLDVGIGDPITFDELEKFGGRKAVLSALRSRTYDLASTLVAEPKKRQQPEQ